MADYYNQSQYSAPPPAQGQYYASSPQHHYPGQDPPGYASSGYYPPDPQVRIAPRTNETRYEINQLTSISNTALIPHLETTTKRPTARVATLLSTAAPPHHQTCK
jgi:hypothetical protein